MDKVNWQEYLGLSSEELDELRYVGYAYIRQGKYDIALPIFEGLCVMDTQVVYDMQTLGALYLQVGEPEKALKWLDRALQIDAEHPPTLLNLAKAFFSLGRNKEGLQLVQLLKAESAPAISNTAKALLLAYS